LISKNSTSDSTPQPPSSTFHRTPQPRHHVPSNFSLARRIPDATPNPHLSKFYRYYKSGQQQHSRWIMRYSLCRTLMNRLKQVSVQVSPNLAEITKLGGTARTMATTPSQDEGPRKLKILMLHGMSPDIARGSQRQFVAELQTHCAFPTSATTPLPPPYTPQSVRLALTSFPSLSSQFTRCGSKELISPLHRLHTIGSHVPRQNPRPRKSAA
jgi:hypothetical protein